MALQQLRWVYTGGLLTLVSPHRSLRIEPAVSHKHQEGLEGPATITTYPPGSSA